VTRPAKSGGPVGVSTRVKTPGGSSPEPVPDRVTAERVRLARELHDWLLQSLTGIALDLQSLYKLVETDAQKARTRITRIQNAVATQQRELRAFIEDLQLVRNASGEPPTLGERLTGLARRFREQWNLAVELDFDPVVHLETDEIQGEIYALVTEAVSNAAKHSGGTRVRVKVRRKDGRIIVTIEDDGKGFPFLGKYTLAQLVELRRGPVTLKERIQSLGGDMVVSSSTGGVAVEARIPSRRRDA
jgi:signal transduction histidine kinase